MNKRILNVGCGNETYGTDFVDLYPSRKEVLKVDVQSEKLPYKNNTFDEVYNKCFLEHLKNPGIFIEDCVRVLKKGGRLILITDNAGHYRFHIKFFKRAEKTHYGNYEKRGRLLGGTGEGTEDKHYLLFTTWHLKNFFENYGLKVEKIEYVNNNYKGIKKYINNFIDFFVGLIDKRLICPNIKIIGIKT
jgi:ubiquinone/menaquinone biosynthesis C-methylase UbiE